MSLVSSLYTLDRGIHGAVTQILGGRATQSATLSVETPYVVPPTDNPINRAPADLLNVKTSDSETYEYTP
jgi:hypothetical protein